MADRGTNEVSSQLCPHEVTRPVRLPAWCADSSDGRTVDAAQKPCQSISGGVDGTKAKLGGQGESPPLTKIGYDAGDVLPRMAAGTVVALLAAS